MVNLIKNTIERVAWLLRINWELQRSDSIPTENGAFTRQVWAKGSQRKVVNIL